MTNLLDKYSSILEEIKNHPQVDSLIIFGSYLNSNKITPLSDLDIAVIFTKDCSQSQKIEILSYTNEELDICDFEVLPLSLQFKIISSNNIIKKSSSYNSIKVQTMTKWLDFKPRLAKMYRRKGFNENYLY
ncbi:MAG: nucleotidyltransferase domain-containing protein [Nanoarchaeota archaeon]|nr:nucleotidyltransferase domain-containing protein [Nanoarchaeota archaeon]